MMTNEKTIPAVRPTGLLGSEDWWAVWLGLFITLLGLGKIWGFDLLGWAATFGVWIDPAKAVGTGSKPMPGWAAPERWRPPGCSPWGSLPWAPIS